MGFIQFQTIYNHASELTEVYALDGEGNIYQYFDKENYSVSTNGWYILEDEQEESNLELVK